MRAIAQVGVTGFCMGGALSFLGAEYAGLDAAAPFYGTPPAELGHVSKASSKLHTLTSTPASLFFTTPAQPACWKAHVAYS